jgi:hypothetical protein
MTDQSTADILALGLLKTRIALDEISKVIREMELQSVIEFCNHCGHSKAEHTSNYLDCPPITAPGRKPKNRSTRYQGTSRPIGALHEYATKLTRIMETL